MSDSGLYIHIPFCRTKCPYCGFYSLASSSLVPRWLNALKKEVIYYRGMFKCFDSLYLGGGTPTLLSIKELQDILDCLFDNFEIADDAEITIEANPCDMTGEKIAGLRSLGFNRINLGVQSFNDRDLAFLGRRHSAYEAEKALRALRTSGFDNIGMDLIYGMDGQPLERWRETLEKALVHRPEHLSCYQLSVEEGTVFWKMLEKGEIQPLEEEMERAFFELTSEFLEDNGYIHYEISNFARDRAFYSHHNCKYWSHVPYLGLGPSAHSFKGNRRWWNHRSIRRYCDALEQGQAPIEGDEELTDEQRRLESVSLGLRTREGFNLKEIDHGPEIKEAISRLRDSGHILFSNGHIIPTRKGFLVADRLPLCFFP